MLSIASVKTVILVIGPSGVGKTTCVEYAPGKLQGCRFFDLDKLVGDLEGMLACQVLGKVGADAFLQRCQREVDRLSSTDIVSVFDVGAGALESPLADTWVSDYQGSTIAVVAPADEVYRRGGQKCTTRSLAAFTDTEYSQHRLSVYNIARHQCDVMGLSVENAGSRFTEMLRTLLT